ncbi:MAG: hypothetical protein E7166_06475 [Firmicutes bacterium]|nr:hypothetical protein [Bacillota bacterium]
MTCSSCKYLKEEKRVEGKVCGACYYCSNFDKYVKGSDNKCEKHERNYGRNNYNCDKIYNEGLEYYDDDKPIAIYIVELVLFVILAIILNICSF